MQLLFSWIHRYGGDDGNLIVEKGFNFNPEYRFSVSVNKKASSTVYTLTCQHTDTVALSFADTCIQNITAVVGKNGSGKTTLLLALQRNSLLPKTVDQRDDCANYFEKLYAKAKRLLVYLFDQNDIRIYHNYNENEWTNETQYDMYCISGLNGKNYIKYTDAADVLKMQSVIYLTNSAYLNDEETSQIMESNVVEHITLHPKFIKTIAARFFQKTVMAPQSAYIPSPKIFLNNLLIKNKNEQDFQQIWDLIYYHILTSEKRIDGLIGKWYTRKSIYFSNVISLIQETTEYEPYLNRHSTIPKSKSEIERLHNRIINFVDWENRYFKEQIRIKANPMVMLLHNFIFEMYICYHTKLPEPPKGNRVDVNFDSLLRVAMHYLFKKAHINKIDTPYFKNSLEEIKELYFILKSLPITSNLTNIDDGEYISKIIVSRNDAELFDSYSAYIDKCAQQPFSFILKYMAGGTQTQEMSSGERAYLNLFSWLELPPRYGDYIGKPSIQIANNVLLLIDEIDLYMHPEWQRSAIKRLINAIVNQYGTTDQGEGRNVQVVVATHSPLILSDVPKQNTIFLENMNGKLALAAPEYQPQTFGTNLTTILNNAFFLKSMIGEFAFDRISAIANRLLEIKRKKDNYEMMATSEEIDACILPTIQTIGEPLLRDRLLLLYNECFPNAHSVNTDVYPEYTKQTLKKRNTSEGDQMLVEQLKQLLSRALDLLNKPTE